MPSKKSGLTPETVEAGIISISIVFGVPACHIIFSRKFCNKIVLTKSRRKNSNDSLFFFRSSP